MNVSSFPARACAAYACLIAVSGCASHPGAAHRTRIEREDVVTVTAIDVPNRLVTVRDAAGESLTLAVDQSNTSFPQAAAGDRVRIRYVESIALKLSRKDTPGLKVEEKTSRPAPGRASGKTTTEMTAVVRIEAVGQNGRFVAFTGPRGRRTVQVHDHAMREYVSKLVPGDTVEVTYQEALALSLEKVGS